MVTFKSKQLYLKKKILTIHQLHLKAFLKFIRLNNSSNGFSKRQENIPEREIIKQINFSELICSINFKAVYENEIEIRVNY